MPGDRKYQEFRPPEDVAKDLVDGLTNDGMLGDTAETMSRIRDVLQGERDAVRKILRFYGVTFGDGEGGERAKADREAVVEQAFEAANLYSQLADCEMSVLHDVRLALRMVYDDATQVLRAERRSEEAVVCPTCQAVGDLPCVNFLGRPMVTRHPGRKA